MNGQGSGGSGMRRGGGAGIGVGEIVEVEGGHIIRSTGRKDRHSKVCTAKGPRDRRVRLSAHTAIQFYDVQDRLGYDRPSKAVDWLINKAKSAIDELDELPPWNPLATANNSSIPASDAGDRIYSGNNEESSSLLSPSMDSDSIADTINVTAADTAAPAVQFQSYPSLDSRSQDLRLSLQSFQDPMRIQSNRNQEEEEEEEQQSPFGFDNPPAVTGWEETQPPDFGRFQRLIGWNLASAGNYGASGGGFMFIPPPPQQQPPPILFGHGVGQAATHFFTQRGTLQSNNTPLVRAIINGENSVINQDHHYNQGVSIHPVSFPGFGFGSSSGGFSSFHIPARIQGDHEEEQDGNKPSSVASTSRH